ncbi:discoidin domain-containing receptor 2-like isoform X2 [Gambusia affinis]|uniref:discoidin domain-containing receptor 2-like isoform X2 n=1 Tax=Gambusia affinis TaxID=33528 RepID=UPI001CDC0300|nr:discoidin domain-containing receptor 2-like isoform X2 [Gambusia affinis]
MHLFLLLLLQLPAASGQIDPEHCRYALGMEDGRIPDQDLTASSRWYETTGPQYARLNSEDGDGAWCPEGQLEPSDSQYLQIDLRRLAFLTLVGTQGRYARGLGKEFAAAYRLNYSRDGQLWKAWKNRLGKEVLEGNKDTYGVFSNDLKPPIIARYVRVIPVTRLSTTVCMRVELYGCPWDDGLLSYSAPEGQLMMSPGNPAVISLNDSTYDGVHEKRKLFGGLGQLTDGVTGRDDFLAIRQYNVWQGYDYLGWRNDTPGTQGYVEMEFVFDRLRNFTSMKVHSNNMYSRGVKIFSSVSCWFKPFLSWEPESVSFSTILDDRNPSARYVTVPLSRRAARSLRCRFYYADVWMMFSEISFQSDIILPTQQPLMGTSVPGGRRDVTMTTAPKTDNTAAAPSASSGSDPDNTAILIGCLVTIILLLVIIIFLILWCQCVCKVLEKAPRQILDEEVTVRLSSCSDTIILQTPPVPPRSRHPPAGPTNTDPHYERVFLLDPQYQNPAVLRNKLPELSQSAETSGKPDLHSLLSPHSHMYRPKTNPLHLAEPEPSCLSNWISLVHDVFLVCGNIMRF